MLGCKCQLPCIPPPPPPCMKSGLYIGPSLNCSKRDLGQAQADPEGLGRGGGSACWLVWAGGSREIVAWLGWLCSYSQRVDELEVGNQWPWRYYIWAAQRSEGVDLRALDRAPALL